MFLLALSCVFRLAFAQADDALLLTDSVEASRVRLSLIHNAQKEIILSMYIFEEDHTGQKLLAAIAKACTDRNVQTTLILDHLSEKISPAMKNLLTQNCVKIFHYGAPKISAPLEYSERLHAKLLLVDREHLVLGDRNVSNKYFGGGKDPFVSKDIYLRGESAARTWNNLLALVQMQKITEWKTKKLSAKKMQRAQNDLEHAQKQIAQEDVWMTGEEDWHKKVKPVDKVEFFLDSADTKGKAPGIETEILASIRSAESHILIENPYIILTKEFQDELYLAASRGVKIEVVTNSMGSSDSKLVAAAWENTKPFFMRIGADVWEHPGGKSMKRDELPPIVTTNKVERKRRRFYRRLTRSELSMLHAKTMVVDGKTAFVMSYNLDPRSQHLNLEAAAKISDGNFSQRLVQNIEADKRLNDYVATLVSGREVARLPQCSIFYRWLAKAVEKQL